MSNQKHLGEAPIGKLLLQYSVPAIIGMIVNALYNIVDRMFIGNIPNIGSLAITGVGITMPIMTIILAFGMLIGIGATANISLNLGKGNRPTAEKLLGNAFTLSIIVGLAIAIVGTICANPILNLFGASENTLFYAKEYLNIILLGCTFNILSFSLNSTVRADGNPKMSSLTMVIGCGTNIILDYVFIFIFNLGVKGAALATIISQAITFFIILYYYTIGNSNLKLKVENFKLKKHLVTMTFAIGIAPFATQIANSLVQVIANNALKTYGSDLAIGAMTVISSLNIVFMMPIFGINQGCQPIIGFNYGAKKYKRAKETFKYATMAACVICIIGFTIIQCFPTQIISLFNNDPKLTNLAMRGIRIYLLMMPIVGINIVATSYYQSIGKAKVSMFVSLLRQVILLIPFTIILPKFIGLDGVWAAGACADSLSVIITLILLRKEFKQLDKMQLESVA
ncbi:MAG: MATE family efflux transporter [Clostridium sp.]|uniref:MATE family efflux transporter n=1 Tax=Clostridium sp. TaxID=1506 RepID=UPI002672031C|nr:MATE family efflux transporter [Clostridium sp.]MCI7031248.1 MATE family efflux transporter [Clostridium sp.]MDD7681525.1 MATE family efflux transporter [Clostridium sp.]MDY2579392.1 MATE family efflux transporter [Clostridium sp.]